MTENKKSGTPEGFPPATGWHYTKMLTAKRKVKSETEGLII